MWKKWVLSLALLTGLPELIFAGTNIRWENLNVPVYIRTSFSMGYDSNFLRLSSEEIDAAGTSPEIIGDSNTFDSAVFRPEIRLNYNPILIKGKNTNFTLNAARVKFSQSDNKSYSVVSFLVEQHLGPYRWLRFGYVIAPQLLLRYYRDKDHINPAFLTSTFSNETAYLTYSFKVYDKSWLRIKPRLNRQYFNQYFTEYNTEVKSVEVRVYSQLVPHYKFSVWVATGTGDNISFDDGLISTGLDRSYETQSTGIQVVHYPLRILNLVSFSLLADERRYNSEAADDPLHAGRKHIDYKSTLLLIKRLPCDVSAQLRFNYRFRDTRSAFDWVEAQKSFSKFEIWLKFSYDFSLDLFY